MQSCPRDVSFDFFKIFSGITKKNCLVATFESFKTAMAFVEVAHRGRRAVFVC